VHNDVSIGPFQVSRCRARFWNVDHAIHTYISFIYTASDGRILGTTVAMQEVNQQDASPAG
jgi:hypothetical protein